MSVTPPKYPLNDRFRGFLPVVVDVETGGFDCTRHALLEIAAAPIEYDQNGLLTVGSIYSCHVIPFEGSEIDPNSARSTTSLRLSGKQPSAITVHVRFWSGTMPRSIWAS
jgi:ribonuclease T